LRNTFAIFFLLVLSIPFLCTRAILLHRKSESKEAVKARILAGVDKSEMVRLVFSVNDAKTALKWEHSKEFEYRGEMYDIVKSEGKTDSVIYWCIRDKDETQLNRQLESLVALATGSDPQHQSSLNNLFIFLKFLFCHKPREVKPAVASAGTIFHFYLPVKYAFPPVPPAPPPEARLSRF